MKVRINLINLFLVGLFLTGTNCVQTFNKHEFREVAELPDFPGLQDPFLKADRSRLQSKKEWEKQRTYLKKMLTHYMYGKMPPKPDNFKIEKVYSKAAFNDSIIEEVFHVLLERNGKTARFKTGIRRPNRTGKFPVIIKNDSWIFDIQEVEKESSRKKYIKLERDKIEDYVAHEAAKRGYVICKFNRNEVAPDNSKYKEEGVISLYPEYNWGTIAAWAWAYQILIDYFEKQEFADAKKIAATGHSRGGKTALCAGVYDERIAITAPSSSGGGGTASWRYFDLKQKRQLVSYHMKRFPHWWTPELYKFSNTENKMPFDAHFQKALVAPRGLINVHSREDYWANPYGTYLTYLSAEVVYNWLGADGKQGVHWRNGPHNQNQEDWHAIFEFCDNYFFNKKTDVDFTQNPHPEMYNFDGLVTFKAPK